MKKSRVNFESEIVMGDRYRDTQTAFEGVATAVYFYQYGCERVNLEAYDSDRKDIRALTFDAPRLVHIESGQPVTVTRTGGPGTGREARKDAGAQR